MYLYINIFGLSGPVYASFDSGGGATFVLLSYEFSAQSLFHHLLEWLFFSCLSRANKDFESIKPTVDAVTSQVNLI